jgi:hypothetical protein
LVFAYASTVRIAFLRTDALPYVMGRNDYICRPFPIGTLRQIDTNNLNLSYFARPWAFRGAVAVNSEYRDPTSEHLANRRHPQNQERGQNVLK